MSVLRIISPAPREVWQAVLAQDRSALVSQSPEWLDCICAAEAYADASRLYEFADGRQAVLPLVRRRNLPAALAVEASPPYGWGFGGLLSTAPLEVEAVAAIFADLARQPALHIGLRPNPLHAAAWRSAAPPAAMALARCAHVLDLTGGFEQVWAQRFSSDTRRKIRKAEQAGLRVERDTDGRLLPVFYELFLESLDRWAEQQHEPKRLARWRGRQRDPLSKFRLMRDQLGEAFRLWVAWSGEQPAAAILVLQGANAHYTRGAMNKVLAGATYANYLLHRLAIEEACRAGSRSYHMGETGASKPLAQFKGHFGATPYTYAEYRLERLPLSRVDAALRRLIKQLIGFKDA